MLSDPETHSCLLLPPTARLCQHHRDGHPQVPKREEPTQGKKGEQRSPRAWLSHLIYHYINTGFYQTYHPTVIQLEIII